METNLHVPQRLFTQPVQYKVPDYQDRQWEPLWNDVENLAELIIENDRTVAPHFMGAVVLQHVQFPTGTIERRIVVDGQQRLITLQLLIDAIQKVLFVRVYLDPARRLSALVDNREEFRDGDETNAFKVWPTAVDREAFRHAMNTDLPGDEYTASRIVQAHDYFKGQVEQWLDKAGNEDREGAHRAAAALEKVVRAKLELVVIDLGASDDPHVIFQTLNARGTPLLQSDMVKNKILYDAKIESRDDDSHQSPEERQLWPFADDWWPTKSGADCKGDRVSTCFSTTGLSFETGRRPSRTTSSVSLRNMWPCKQEERRPYWESRRILAISEGYIER